MTDRGAAREYYGNPSHDVSTVKMYIDIMKHLISEQAICIQFFRPFPSVSLFRSSCQST